MTGAILLCIKMDMACHFLTPNMTTRGRQNSAHKKKIPTSTRHVAKSDNKKESGLDINVNLETSNRVLVNFQKIVKLPIIHYIYQVVGR